jgi:hypothetical protein
MPMQSPQAVMALIPLLLAAAMVAEAGIALRARVAMEAAAAMRRRMPVTQIRQSTQPNQMRVPREATVESEERATPFSIPVWQETVVMQQAPHQLSEVRYLAFTLPWRMRAVATEPREAT